MNELTLPLTPLSPDSPFQQTQQKNFKRNCQSLQDAIALPNVNAIFPQSHRAQIKSISCAQLKDRTHRTRPLQSTSAFQT